MKQFLLSPLQSDNASGIRRTKECQHSTIISKYWGFNQKIQGFHNIYQ